MLQQNHFKCDMCGLCCQKVGTSPIYKNLDRGDGICRYYEEVTHRCSVYAQRPLICNVEDFYSTYLVGKLTKEEFYIQNYAMCNRLKQDFKEKEK